MTNKATDKPLTLQQCKDKATIEITSGEYKTYEAIEGWIGITIGIHVPIIILTRAAELYKDSALEAQKTQHKIELSNYAYQMDMAKRDRDNAERKHSDSLKEIEALKQALKKAHNIPPYL